MLTLDKIYKASHVLRSVIRKTDLIHAPLVNPDSEIYLKTENLQITGSFKVRGAYYMMSQLTEEEKAQARKDALKAYQEEEMRKIQQRHSRPKPTAKAVQNTQTELSLFDF